MLGASFRFRFLINFRSLFFSISRTRQEEAGSENITQLLHLTDEDGRHGCMIQHLRGSWKCIFEQEYICKQKYLLNLKLGRMTWLTWGLMSLEFAYDSDMNNYETNSKLKDVALYRCKGSNSCNLNIVTVCSYLA